MFFRGGIADAPGAGERPPAAAPAPWNSQAPVGVPQGPAQVSPRGRPAVRARAVRLSRCSGACAAAAHNIAVETPPLPLAEIAASFSPTELTNLSTCQNNVGTLSTVYFSSPSSPFPEICSPTHCPCRHKKLLQIPLAPQRQRRLRLSCSPFASSAQRRLRGRGDSRVGWGGGRVRREQFRTAPPRLHPPLGTLPRPRPAADTELEERRAAGRGRRKGRGGHAACPVPAESRARAAANRRAALP